MAQAKDSGRIEQLAVVRNSKADQFLLRTLLWLMVFSGVTRPTVIIFLASKKE
jgi:hypothetical protein